MKLRRSLVGNYSATRRLTRRQEECLAILKRFYAAHARMPTTKELQHQMGDCSHNTIRPMLARLVAKGALRWLPHGSLNIQFADTGPLADAQDKERR